MRNARVGKEISRYALADMAIRAAMALERFTFDEPLDGEIIATFADALANTSRADRLGEHARYFAAGYHSPYMRLGLQETGAASVTDVQELLGTKANAIRQFLEHPEKAQVGNLVSFCTDLHHELAQSQLADIRLAKRARLQPQANRGSTRVRKKASSSAS